MKNAWLRAMVLTLDDIEVGSCVFDMDDRAVAWNATFLRFFPEHDGHVYLGEPYADNLRRFYTGRLSADEAPHIDRYIRDGIERHRNQRRPYEFAHRGRLLRVSSFEVEGVGRARIWRHVADLAVPSQPKTLEERRAFDPGTSPLLENIAEGILVVDDGDFALWANQTFCSVYQFSSPADVVGRTFEEIYARAWTGHQASSAFAGSLARLKEHRRFAGAPFELALPDERCVRVVERRGNAMDGRGYLLHVDITAMKQQQERLERAEARYRFLEDHSSDVVVVLTSSGTVRYASPAITSLIGLAPHQVVGRNAVEFGHPEDLKALSDAMGSLHAGPQADYRVRLRRADGSYVWVEARARGAEPQGDSVSVIVVNVRNIDARKATEDQLAAALNTLQDLAVTDPLTGVANRRRFDECLALEWRRAQREGIPLSLLMVDIDHFKLVNDTFGHQAGDEVLKVVAKALEPFAQRAGDVFARYGGEEFALLLPNAPLVSVQQLAEKAREAVASVPLAGLATLPAATRVTVSIGVASTALPFAIESSDDLVRLADFALLRAKREGRNRFAVSEG